MEERRNMVKISYNVSAKEQKVWDTKGILVYHIKKAKIFVEQVIRTGEKMGKSFCMD